MDLTFTGRVIAVLEKREGIAQSTGNQWTTQSFVMETTEQYPKKCCAEIFGAEKIQQLLPNVGDEITAHIEIDCREYQNRWYNTIRCWKVEKIGAQQPQQSDNGAIYANEVRNPTPSVSQPARNYQQQNNEQQDDGLPF